MTKRDDEAAKARLREKPCVLAVKSASRRTECPTATPAHDLPRLGLASTRRMGSRSILSLATSWGLRAFRRCPADLRVP